MTEGWISMQYGKDKNIAAEMAAMSGRYRAAMVEAMLHGRKTVLVAQIGHGTSLAAVSAAAASGAKDLLAIVPKHMAEGVAAQLEAAGIAVAGSSVGKKKGCAADMCREALKRRLPDPGPGKTRVWLAAPNQAAEIGNWYEAWKDALEKDLPFGMLFVFDGGSFANERSERGRGVRFIADRVGHAVMFLDEQAAPQADIVTLSANFGTVVRPSLARRAANACEAMAMDAD